MKISSLLLIGGLLLAVLSCGTLPAGNKPDTEANRSTAPDDPGTSGTSGTSGLQGPSEPFIESTDESQEYSQENSSKSETSTGSPEVHTVREDKLTGIEDLPVRLPLEKKPLPGLKNMSLPDVPDIQRDPYRNILTANDLDPQEPDHYYLRKKPVEESSSEEKTIEATPDSQKEPPRRIDRPDAEDEVVIEESSRKTEENVRRAPPEVPENREVPESSDTPEFSIAAVTGEKIQISLPDHSWVYDRNSSSSDGVDFEGTQYLQDSKEFLFQALRVGDYLLSFNKPDFNTGKVEVRTVAVTIGEVQEEGVKQSVDDILGRGSEVSGSSGVARRSFSAESLRSGISERDGAIIGQQLSLLVESFSTEELNSDDGEGREKGGMAEPGSTEVVWSEVLDGVKQLEESVYEPAAERALQLFLTHAAGRFERLGEAYFLLGKIYETPVPPRDEKKAVDYYRQVLEIYPADIYHFKAEERIKYLERHFLQIR